MPLKGDGLASPCPAQGETGRKHFAPGFPLPLLCLSLTTADSFWRLYFSLDSPLPPKIPLWWRWASVTNWTMSEKWPSILPPCLYKSSGSNGCLSEGAGGGKKERHKGKLRMTKAPRPFRWGFFGCELYPWTAESSPLQPPTVKCWGFPDAPSALQS